MQRLRPAFTSCVVTALALTLALALASGCAPKRAEAPELDSIPRGGLVNAQGRHVSDAEFLKVARLADYILVGETHDSPCDHAAQARLMATMLAAGVPFAAGLEMVGADKQHVIDDYLAGAIEREQLPHELDWMNTWGYAYPFYEPFFLMAKEFDFPLLALNIPRAVLDKLPAAPGAVPMDQPLDGQALGLSMEEAAHLPERVISPTREQRETLRLSYEQHLRITENLGTGGDTGFERFLTVQSLWDTTMAENAVAARRELGLPVFILAGLGHVEYGWGIPHRIKTLAPEAKILTVAPWRGGALPDPEAADIFFACPIVHKSRIGLVLRWTEAEDGAQAEVVEVEDDSRAARADFQEGDILLSAGGEPVRTMWDLHLAAMKAREAEGVLPVTVLRRGQEVTLDLDVSAPPTPPTPPMDKPEQEAEAI